MVLTPKAMLTAIAVATALLAVGTLLFFLQFRINRVEKSIYLIPDGYVGPVVIIHRLADGKQAKYEDGVRIYEIPANGVLVTRFPIDSGTYLEGDRQFFYLTKEGAKKELPFVLQWTAAYQEKMSNAELDRPSVYGYTFGTVARSGNPQLKNEYFKFVVGRLRDSAMLLGLRDRMPVSDL